MEKYGLRSLLDFNDQEDQLLRVNAGTPRPVTVSGELTREHPEPVARYLAMLQQTARWALNHPEDVITAIVAETGATPDAVRRGFGPHLHKRFSVSLSPLNLSGLRAQKAFLVREGIIADFDFDAWIDERPLEIATRFEGVVSLDFPALV